MKPGAFRWNEWNREQTTKHGCTIAEIESVVRRYGHLSRKCGGEKWKIEGRGQGDRFIEVIYFYDDDDDDDTIYVIHAMPLTTRRRRRRR